MDNISYYGHVFETTYLDADLKINDKNHARIDELCEQLPAPDATVSKPYFRDVKKIHIANLIRKFEVPRISYQFSTDQLVDFILNNGDPALDKWDVLFAGGAKSSYPQASFKHDINVDAIERKCDFINNGSVIRVSGSAVHIGSRDTKYGLTPKQINAIMDSRSPEQQREGTSQKMFMIKGRNPLLIVYPIRPKDLWSEDERNLYVDLAISESHNNLMALAVCFPQSDKNTGETHLYKVNRAADYFSKEGHKSEMEEL